MGQHLGAEGKEIRDRMHLVLAAGMAPSEVANKVVTKVRGDGLYLLTDHEWDDQVIARHEAIMLSAGRTRPPPVGGRPGDPAVCAGFPPGRGVKGGSPPFRGVEGAAKPLGSTGQEIT